MKSKIQYTKPATVAVALGVGMAGTIASASSATELECTATIERPRPVSVGKESTPTATARVRVPVEWNEQAKGRFSELMLLKAQQKTSEAEDREFQELYDAREDALDQCTTEERIKEYERKQAFRNLLNAFDHYVSAEKVAY